VDLVLLSPEESVSAAVGDVAELGDVDLAHRAGMVVFVAAQGFAGDTIWQWVTASKVEAGSPRRPAIRTGPSRWRRRSRTMVVRRKAHERGVWRVMLTVPSRSHGNALRPEPWPAPSCGDRRK
jgi:hypothetical protein